MTRRYHTRASVQSHAVVPVPFPARLTDAVVDGDVHLRIELQSEDVGRGERIALLAPLVAPQTTAVYRTATLGGGHTEVATNGDSARLTAEVEDV
jgi:hypothetical protein